MPPRSTTPRAEEATMNGFRKERGGVHLVERVPIPVHTRHCIDLQALLEVFRDLRKLAKEFVVLLPVETRNASLILALPSHVSSTLAASDLLTIVRAVERSSSSASYLRSLSACTLLHALRGRWGPPEWNGERVPLHRGDGRDPSGTFEHQASCASLRGTGTATTLSTRYLWARCEPPPRGTKWTRRGPPPVLRGPAAAHPPD